MNVTHLLCMGLPEQAPALKWFPLDLGLVVAGVHLVVEDKTTEICYIGGGRWL